MKALNRKLIIPFLFLIFLITLPSFSHADWEFGWNDTDISIPDTGSWVISPITINTAAPSTIVNRIDVYLEITHTEVSDLWIFLSNGNDQGIYLCQSCRSGSDLTMDITNLTAFNGNTVNQTWKLWVSDGYSGDTGYIDYWDITVFHDPPPAPGLSSPGNGSTVNGASVSFQWNQVITANNYRIQASRDSGFSQLIFDSAIGNYIGLNLGGFPDNGTQYWWRVAGGGRQWRRMERLVADLDFYKRPGRSA